MTTTLNINTIAKLSGVSKSTVSRVLSKNGSVSKEAYEKVMRVINENHYTPNRYARILNNMPTHLIGIVSPDITNPYFPEIIECITTIASDNGYRVILCNTNKNNNTEISYLGMLREMQVDGTILLCPTNDIDLSDIQDMPIVSIDSIINENIPYVCSDFYKGGYIAGSKLLENGCRNILHISGTENFYANIQRRNGFEAALMNCKSRKLNLERLSNLSTSSCYNEIKEFIISHPDIDGVFADNDSFAFSVLRILNELSISVPDRISVIGYDDNFMIPMVYPLLSTIHQPITEIGATAITTLLDLIKNHQIKRTNILDVSYVKRNTTKV